ncbi:hypothetical protein IAU59_002732 [Kwoniella sp. CBS 9459]
MASNDDYTPSNGGGPPSLVPSRASSALSTPPEPASYTSEPFFNQKTLIHPAGTGGDVPSRAGTPSGGSPHLPQLQAQHVTPGSQGRKSPAKTPPKETALVGSTISNPGPQSGPLSHHGSPALPEVVVTSYSNEEDTIDPSLRDQFLTSTQSQNAQQNGAAQGQARWDTLPPIQAQHQYQLNGTPEAGDGAGADTSLGGDANLPVDPEMSLPQIQNNQNGVPNFTLGGWNLPSLGGMGYSGDDSTRPSTQTNSPTSPPGASHGLWASSFDGSITDLNSYASGAEGDGGIDGLSRHSNGHVGSNGMSAASSESGFDIGAGTGSGGKEGEGGVPPPPKKKSHARKQPEGHIKRARNAFILFRKHITDSNLIPPSVEVKHQNISVVAAKMWKEAPQDVRQKFQEQARIEKEEHQRRFPGYRYQPVFRRTDIIRRRVRKDPAEDEKVEAVAEALIQGKAGDALESEIKDQMVSRSEASESEAESTRSTSRRRRRDVGQLSKGAIRAQRAQARAKQMRQNLLGTNLLNMSLYNAATNRIANSAPQQHHHQQHPHAHQQHPYSHAMHQAAHAPGGYPSHPGAQHYASGMYTMEGYMPMGYDLDGRPFPLGPEAASHYGTEMYAPVPAAGHGGAMAIPEGMGHESEMYRLPPINGMVDVGTGYEAWQNPMGDAAGAGPGQVEYWDQPIPGSNDMTSQLPPHGSYSEMNGEDYYAPSYNMAGAAAAAAGGSSGADERDGVEHAGAMGADMSYRLPPLMETSREGASTVGTYDSDTNTRARPGRNGPTPAPGMAGSQRPSDDIASSYAAASEFTHGGLDTQDRTNANVSQAQARLRSIRDWTKNLESTPEGGSVSVSGSVTGEGGGMNQQTPSGHVLFNERLFDGALGTAGFQDQDRGKDEGVDGIREMGRRDADEDALGMFDQAMEQAGQVSW